MITKGDYTSHIVAELDAFIYQEYKRAPSWKYNFPFYYLRFSSLHLQKNLKIHSSQNAKSTFLLLTKKFPEYFFMFDIKKWTLKSPEKMLPGDIEHVKAVLARNPYDYYALSAFLIYSYHSGDLQLDTYFSKFFQLDPKNEHMLARYARYHASSLYKLDGDILHLKIAKQTLLQAIKYRQLGEPFLYSWLGNVYYEENDYLTAIKHYKKAQKLNQSLGFLNPEIIFWQAKVFTKLGNYKKSLRLCGQILQNYRHKICTDFRLFKLMSENYVHVGNLKMAKQFLDKALSVFLKHKNLQVTYFGKNFDIKRIGYPLFDDIFIQNRFESFSRYNSPIFRGKHKNIYMQLGFFYKEKILGAPVHFIQSRGLEENVFLYLQKMYETHK